MHKFLVLGLVLCFSSCSKLVSKKDKSFFVHGVYGHTIAGDSEDKRPSAITDDKIDHDTGSGYQVGIGYRGLKGVGFEAVYGDFGKPSINYKDLYSVEKSVRFLGGGLHFFLWIFDFKIGAATYRGTRKFTIDPSATSTVVIDPESSRITSSGNYFGMGLNFDIGERLEFVVDYTGYVFKEKKVTYTINGVTQTFPTEGSNAEDPKTHVTGFVGIVGIGLRYFF